MVLYFPPVINDAYFLHLIYFINLNVVLVC